MSATIDQQFIEYIVRSLVSNPDDVSIDRTIDEKGVLLLLSVHPDDLGRVIGKKGATAQSIRTLLRALGTKNSERFNLKIVDTGESDSQSKPAEQSAEQSNEDHQEFVAKPTSEEVPVSEEASQASESDVVRRTRAELADLDDLDI